MENEAKRFIAKNNLSDTVQLIGRLSKDELENLIRDSRVLVWPSEGYYETFGYVAIESFSCGVPVIASRIGVLGEVVKDGVTGLHFNPGDPFDLAAKVQWAWDHPDEMFRMGQNARKEYEEKYTAEHNYQMLIDIYQHAIENNNSGKQRITSE